MSEDKKDRQDLIIIGGGIMGLFTAYAASHFTHRITILEKLTIGNQQAASFSYTRSIRNDYLDPLYARLAYEARTLWQDVQRHAEEPFIIDCGCLNLAKASVTPALTETYAEQSYRVLSDLHLKAEAFSKEELEQRFPQFAVDLGRLDVEAGMLAVPVVTRTLLNVLRERQIRIVEEVEVAAIEQRPDGLLSVRTSAGPFIADKLVIAAGLGTNTVLKRIAGCTLQFPLSPDRPSQCKYYIPPADKRAMFLPAALPVFAYLDVGIYGHPIYEGRTPGVKIGFYHPPDVHDVSVGQVAIPDIASFVAECMPSLQDAQAIDVTDVDQCFYDLVADDNFILGHLPDNANISVGVGWRGTGYKYAPWVGRTLTQLALQEGTVYDIRRFSPQRFVRQEEQ